MERTLVALPAGTPAHSIMYGTSQGRDIRNTSYLGCCTTLYPSPTLSECGTRAGAVVASVDVDPRSPCPHFPVSAVSYFRLHAVCAGCMLPCVEGWSLVVGVWWWEFSRWPLELNV